MTVYPEIFAALAAPFDSKEVKLLSKGGKTFSYITARTVINRLNQVLGPENWEDNYHEQSKGTLCTLTVKLPAVSSLPNGQILHKHGAGGPAGMKDPGDDFVSAHSDALKHAAVKYGVGLYLYEEGVVDYTAENGPRIDLESVVSRITPPAPKPATEAPRGLPGSSSGGYDNFRKPTFGKAMFPWVKNLEEYYQVELLKQINGWTRELGAGWKMADWTEDQVSQVADKVIEFLKTLTTYHGEFDHVAAPQLAPTAMEGQVLLSRAKDQLINKLTELFVWQNPGQKPTTDQLRDALASLSPLAVNSQGSTGEVATSLRSMTDLTWVENIIKLAEEGLASLKNEAIDACPF
jgi:hypothetical protein